jgi:hypothetical protein
VTGYCAEGLEALGLLCTRLHSPEDQFSLSTKYARPQSAISEITNETAAYINTTWGHILDWDVHGLVSPDALRTYAAALHAFGAPMCSIVGFLDCTIRKTCRPHTNQELLYTGYKKCHGMKFQGVVIPNGLIAPLAGPFRAPQNDSSVLKESILFEKIEMHAVQPGSHPGDVLEDRWFQLYGDSAYGVSPFLVSPFAGVGERTADEHAWNTTMGRVCISVEHLFGVVIQEWPFLNTFWKQKVLGNACGLMYWVAVLLTNAQACMVPNQTAQCYGCAPPTLVEYFHE